MWHYRIVMVAVVGLLLLAACGDDDPLRSDAPQVPSPNAFTVLEGCETTALEQWYEEVSLNAQAFRDESFGFSTMSASAVSVGINRLSDLRDTLVAASVPDCMADLQAELLANMDITIDSFVQYRRGEIDQARLLALVTSQHEHYDRDIAPVLQAAQEDLAARLSSE